MPDFDDLIFQAKCTIDSLERVADDGGRLVAFNPDNMCAVTLVEDRYQEHNMATLTDLLKAMQSLPIEEPE